MEIKVGQIWKRIPPLDNKFFPKQGWKVEIVMVSESIVTHKIVEYDGEPREGVNLVTSHFMDDFLSMYELEEE